VYETRVPRSPTFGRKKAALFSLGRQKWVGLIVAGLLALKPQATNVVYARAFGEAGGANASGPARAINPPIIASRLIAAIVAGTARRIHARLRLRLGCEKPAPVGTPDALERRLIEQPRA
jgi:hypothetical protein